ncbi:MAG: hypothetical protein ACMG6E_03200 [Candidatus Roizmanbacteria bacterium]
MSENLTKIISPKNLYNGSAYNNKGRNQKSQNNKNSESLSNRNSLRVLSPSNNNQHQ